MGRLRRFGGDRNEHEKGDAQLEQALDRIEAPPERERLLGAQPEIARSISVCFACVFPTADEDRAPKPLHV